MFLIAQKRSASPSAAAAVPQALLSHIISSQNIEQAGQHLAGLHTLPRCLGVSKAFVQIRPPAALLRRARRSEQCSSRPWPCPIAQEQLSSPILQCRRGTCLHCAEAQRFPIRSRRCPASPSFPHHSLAEQGRALNIVQNTPPFVAPPLRRFRRASFPAV